VGLETSFPVLYTSLVRTGKISLERLVEAMSTAPRRIFRIGGALEPSMPADIAVLDLENEFTIDSNTFLSKGRSTPFDGWRVRGRVLMTLKDGKAIYNNLTK
ncbi:MAG: amidohydrolase family protein, partial [Bacteroidales bacterium]|nr:amidohydrolase family protein [Bacteroidales bacterium]